MLRASIPTRLYPCAHDLSRGISRKPRMCAVLGSICPMTRPPSVEQEDDACTKNPMNGGEMHPFDRMVWLDSAKVRHDGRAYKPIEGEIIQLRAVLEYVIRRIELRSRV